MGSTGDITNTLQHLNAARNIALSDSSLYSQVVPGLLGVIGVDAQLELRRWGADFLAETFASPVLPGEHKQKLGIPVLDTLKGFLDKPSEDASVIKGVVQTAASLYPYIFRHIIANPADDATWQKMSSIKSSILARMDTAPSGVRICCIKFVQKVVLVQTPGLIADPRRPDQNETSLALVPRDHPIIPPSNLEAEASGLLDRLLGVLQDDSSNALIVTATLNSLGSLVRSRASIAKKIVATVLNFNPLRFAGPHLSSTEKVNTRSIAKTTIAFLTNILKRMPTNPLNGRIQQYVERLKHALVDAFDEASRKRPAPSEPTDGLSDAKRQRLGAEVPGSQPQYPPLPPGPVSYAQLFALTQEAGLKSFDVNAIPFDLVLKIVPPLLASIDKSRFDNALDAVRARYLSLTRIQPNDALSAARHATEAPPLSADDDEDYEPDYPVEDAEQILNNLDHAPADDMDGMRPSDVALGPFSLPPPPPLSDEEAVECGRGAVTRVFGTLVALEQNPATKTQKAGLNRLAATNHDRDAWITVISRLATRSSAGLEEGMIKSEYDSGHSLTRDGFSLSNAIREALYTYVIEDFRRRIDIAISWLNEEWYNDRIQLQQAGEGSPASPQYEMWMLRILDRIVPFLDAKDKVLIRFLSEIPSINESVLQRVTRLAKDPERVQLAVNSIYYLLLYRPPVREICIDALEDLYKDYDDAKTSAGKLLAKWRPQVLETAQPNGTS